MKYLFLILFFVIEIFATTCCDGTYSSSTGRGTCSHHGGVCSGTSTYQTTPSIPTRLSIKCINNQSINLTWNSSDNSSFYRIYSSSSCDYSYEYIGQSYLTSYTISSIETCNICFKVKACTYSSCSEYSSYVKGEDETNFSYNSNTLRFIDGDTIEFYDRTCRLYGIDAPETYYSSKLYNDAEMCQIDEDLIRTAGEESKEFVKSFIGNQSLEVEILGKDTYNRDICIIKLSNGKNLNEELIKEGYAVVWDTYIKDNILLEHYRQYENTAKDLENGLWNEFSNVMTCLSDKRSIFDTDRVFYFHDIAVSVENGDNYKELIFNYQGYGDSKFIINNDSDFELKENEIFITNSKNRIIIYENGYVQISNYSSNEATSNTVFHDFNSSLEDGNLEYTQMVDKNMIKYFLNDILQFTISYYKNSLMVIQHNSSSKFKNDMNLSTSSQVWVDDENDTKSLYILTITPKQIVF